ncbi:hypothetical protein P8935_20225 [Telmatobacter sp. DSM 110680]|uniref:Uncharacterized protein n=1 Tax=Telmatobacter sp. DSM 110680 TaxID=3036704 RepID=A0AAU7DGT3_9BACT
MSVLASPEPQSSKLPTFVSAMQFVRVYWWQSLLISAAVLVPCFWHEHLEAGDLPSHVYNAWLVHLIKSGQAPSLWLARRWNNVLFDFAISGLGYLFQWRTAERIAGGLSVLIFFWGSFALVSSIKRGLAWSLIPCLAIVTYGWTFEMGFMNCYISLGLSFFALAILMRGSRQEQCWVGLLVPIIWLAHPLGVAMLIALGSYTVLARNLTPKRHLYLFVPAILLLFAIHLLVQLRYSYTVSWKPGYVHDGFDQLLLFGPHYLLPARLLRAFVAACLLLELVLTFKTPRWWAAYLLPAELYVLTGFGVLMLPTEIDTVRLHQLGFVSIGYLTERLTTILVVLACCLVGAVRPQKWHLAGFSVIAIVFFGYLYRDTSTINETENQVKSSLEKIPAGQRVVAALEVFPSSNVGTDHIFDRACIEHCFSYANYEPNVAQFRVRAYADSPIVMTDEKTVVAGRLSNYLVQKKDLPLFEVNWCDRIGGSLCTRELAAGEYTPLGFKLDRSWLDQFGRKALLIDLLPGVFVFAIAFFAVNLEVRKRAV